jgi:hypothetical protein
VVFDPFLSMVDLMGEGMVDLNVGFTLSFAFLGLLWQTRELLRLSLLGWGKIPWKRSQLLLLMEWVRFPLGPSEKLLGICVGCIIAKTNMLVL